MAHEAADVRCPKCGNLESQSSTYCPACGVRLNEPATNGEATTASTQTLKGRVLAFDWRVGTGVISGDDRKKYQFAGMDWRPSYSPQKGMAIVFVPDGSRAREVYAISVAPSQSIQQKSKVVAGLLAVFLGWVGIHKFYLGYYRPGFVLLLVGAIGWGTGTVILGLPAVAVGIVEGVIYLTKSDEEFERIYVHERKSWF